MGVSSFLGGCSGAPGSGCLLVMVFRLKGFDLFAQALTITKQLLRDCAMLL